MKSKKTLIGSIIFLFIGIAILIGKDSLGGFFIAFAAITFYKHYKYDEKYKELKNDYMRRLKVYMNKEAKIPTYGVITFKEETMVFSDDYSETITEWEKFQEYKVVKSNLLLFRDRTKGDILVIGKSEIGALEFQKVTAFVKGKIK